MEYATLTLNRGNYSAQQAIDSRPITAGELRDLLEGLDEDAPVIVYVGGYGVSHYAVQSAITEYVEDEE